MSKDTIEELIILGGGTAGWMAATYLNKQLNPNGNQPIKITVIESPDVDIIGVGESTFDSIRGFLKALDISESDFLINTDATLKHGIYFKDWLKGNDEYFHPFEKTQVNDGVDMLHHWVNLNHRQQTDVSISNAVGVQYKVAMDKRSPKLADSGDFDGPLPYSYHLDAVLMGKYLRKVAISRGVNHISAHIDNVELNDDGSIAAVIQESGERHQADFFIDCTGFKAMLMRAMGNTSHVDYSDSLLCDRAIAVQVPLPKTEEARYNPRPYTSSVAQESGWIWDIDLFKRRGCGYVYSSKFSSDERAEQVLKEYLGAQYDSISPRFLKMRVGRAEKFWYKNCVSIGLSGGFIEPLESTGIVFIDSGIRFLVDLFSSTPCSDVLAKRYNKLMANLYDETRNFIELHYTLSERQDTAFWRSYANDVTPGDDLVERMELWKTKIPTSIDFADSVSTFWENSHNFIMYGMNWQHTQAPGATSHVDVQRSKNMLTEMQKIQAKATPHFEPHIDAINRLRSRAQQ